MENCIKFIVINLLLIIGVSATAKSPDLLKDEFAENNKVFNETVFLIRNSWSFLGDNIVTSAKVYTKNKTYDVKFFKMNYPKQEYSFRKVFSVMVDSADSQTTKVVFITNKNTTKTFDIANNDIKYNKNARLDNFGYKHLTYLNDHKTLSHKQNGKDMTARRIAAGVDFKGTFSENISRNRGYYIPKTRIGIIQQVILSYYEGRHTSLHWFGVLDKNYNYFTTYFLLDTHVLYSLSVMTSNEVYNKE